MKQVITVLFLSLLFSCGTSKTVKQSKKTIKGEWVINSISYSEAGTYKVSLFNDVSKTCFEQSTWKFIPNNNSGVYTINDSNCNTGERNFNFTIQEIDPNTGLYNFLLKPTDAKGNSETNQGFRLTLAQLSETNMKWEQTLTVDEKPFTINMNFIKL
ncbi:lipocalin family protein [Psychroserpens sp. NJDZ02]|uniref:lipocalin family protein n=1 Tax=Psychroserpens sp. NJDZ02 TaxID=2570561 RepID=UPI0010A8485C|nr:lipocalin family protein [Psychroserpens sp. NJDZ02]QCE41454.1 lipocalin [Psychroserpens sp. NJDZ02]